MTDPQPPFEHEFDLPAPPDRVFEALIDRGSLETWFASDVEVEPREGGAYRFWGPHTLGAPPREGADQRITAFVPNERLAFGWTVCGVPSHVDFTLKASDYRPFTMGDAPAVPPVPGCKLRVRHALEGALDFSRPQQLVDDHWRLAIGNLFGFLEGNGNVSLPDYADDSAEVRLSIDVEAPPSAVFRALTEPESLNKWMAAAARIELRPGGVYDFGWSSDPNAKTCRILEVEKDRRLVLSWPDWRGDPDVPDQRVTWELEPIASGTRVHLRHDGFVRAADRSDFQQGWTGFLEGLDRVATSIAG